MIAEAWTKEGLDRTLYLERVGEKEGVTLKGEGGVQFLHEK